MKRSKQILLVFVGCLLWVVVVGPFSYAQDDGGTKGFSLQATVDARPPSTHLGTWIIGGVQVSVNEATTLKIDNGPLAAGSCVTLNYLPRDGGNIALQIVSEPLSVCGFSEPPTATPGIETIWRGLITLEGRKDYSGINIFMSEAVCGSATFDQPLATTDSTGAFEVIASPNYQCLRATADAYMSVEQPLVQSDVGQIMLLAGDVNGDEVINILDIAAIAASFDTSNSAVDVNADGIVDIFDIVLAAKNYQR